MKQMYVIITIIKLNKIYSISSENIKLSDCRLCRSLAFTAHVVPLPHSNFEIITEQMITHTLSPRHCLNTAF